MQDFGEPVRRSFLSWFFAALGWKYTLLLPLVGLLAFALTLVLVIRGKGPAQTGALLFIVPLPVIVGMFGVLEGLMSSLQVLAMSETSPRPGILAEGISMSLVTAIVGFLLAAPSYFVATGGLALHALVGDIFSPRAPLTMPSPQALSAKPQPLPVAK